MGVFSSTPEYPCGDAQKYAALKFSGHNESIVVEFV